MPQAAQEELRRRAVALVGEGRSRGEVAGLLEVSRQSVSEWVRVYRLGGERALVAGRRGRRPGEKTALKHVIMTPKRGGQITVLALKDVSSKPSAPAQSSCPVTAETASSG